MRLEAFLHLSIINNFWSDNYLLCHAILFVTGYLATSLTSTHWIASP